MGEKAGHRPGLRRESIRRQCADFEAVRVSANSTQRARGRPARVATLTGDETGSYEKRKKTYVVRHSEFIMDKSVGPFDMMIAIDVLRITSLSGADGGPRLSKMRTGEIEE